MDWCLLLEVEVRMVMRSVGFAAVAAGQIGIVVGKVVVSHLWTAAAVVAAARLED